MRVAIFYPKNLYASWFSLGGYARALERLGHEVLDVPLPGNVPMPGVRVPTIEDLNSCDVVVSAFHEYIQPWLEFLYGREAWEKVTAPVVARFDESFDRFDLGLPERWKELRRWASHFSFPAHQDAARFGGQFLPFGADTNIFRPDPAAGKFYDAAFIGSLYPLRKNYLEELVVALPPEIVFHIGRVLVEDLTGVRGEASTELLALNYRQVKVFFCLPPMSRLLVAKVVDVMAAGTFVMFPKLPGDARRNNELFADGKEIVYYDNGRIAENAKQVARWVADDAGREAIAAAGCAKVHADHTLDGMLKLLLALPFENDKDRDGGSTVEAVMA